MTILYSAPAKGNPRPFGRGLLRSVPTHKADHTAHDAAWWAAELARSEDAHFDRLAEDAAAVERYERGVVYC